MSRYNHPNTTSWPTRLLQTVIILATAAIIVLFLPRSGTVSYHFDMGKPWPYPQFIAPYDFPIYKNDAQLQAERDSLKLLFEPYFDWQADTRDAQLESLKAQAIHLDAPIRRSSSSRTSHHKGIYSPPYKGGVGGGSASVRSLIGQTLQHIYQQGVISSADHDRLRADSVRAIRIINGISVVTRSLDDLYTPKSGYELLLNSLDSIGLARATVNRFNLSRFIIPNLTYNAERSEEYQRDLNASLSPSRGMVLAGQNIIDRGDIVNPTTYDILRSYEKETLLRSQASHQEEYLILLGQSIYVLGIILCLFAYFALFRNDYLNNLRAMSLIIFLCIAFPVSTSLMVRHSLLSVYIVPYAMLPLFVRVFMDSRTAFITHVAAILLCAVALKYPLEFITTQTISGLVAVYCLRDLSERSQIFRTAFLVTFSAIAVYLSIELIHGKTPYNGNSVTALDWPIYRHLLVSGVLLMFAYPFMYGLERLFGFTSNVTLVELSNINRNLLRRLSEVAPGTFQHSMQVSNLAAEVALRIGAKSQLVRTGALYHDIGKITNPPFFTENQTAGVNPPHQLTEQESARIIIRHVTEGLQLADRYRLPASIRAFIATHHGRGLVKYFYISAQNRQPDAQIDEEAYRYPGPNPTTAEQAIVMMADAVEASSRALSQYSEETISQLVDRIIDAQVAEGFFAQCPITFQDIYTAKEVFKEKLKIIYHTRIQYPTLKR